MMRQVFRKLATFMGFGGALNVHTEGTRRPKVNTSIPRAVKRRGPHGSMRIFKSYQTKEIIQ